MAQEDGDGLAGVRTTLAQFAPQISLEEFAGNWAAANYLDDLDAGSEFGYANLRLNRPFLEEEVEAPAFDEIKKINQYGTHYVKFDYSGPTTISFAGDTSTKLFEERDGGDGRYWYAPAPDEMDAQLTLEIDLSPLDAAALEFTTWYDLEAGYDFAYVTISTDEGASWNILTPRHAVIRLPII